MMKVFAGIGFAFVCIVLYVTFTIVISVVFLNSDHDKSIFERRNVMVTKFDIGEKVYVSAKIEKIIIQRNNGLPEYKISVKDCDDNEYTFWARESQLIPEAVEST